MSRPAYRKRRTTARSLRRRVPAARYESLADAFRAHFSREPQAFVSAPGRTEVIGNHTDHNLGRVLAAAVDLDTVAAVAPTDTGVVTLWSAGYDKPFVVDLADLSVMKRKRRRPTPHSRRGSAPQGTGLQSGRF